MAQAPRPEESSAAAVCSTRSASSARSERRLQWPSLAPDLASDLCNQLQLAALVVRTEQVAFGHRREPALWTDRELLGRHVLRGLVDAPQQVVFSLELALLGGDQPQHDSLAARHEAQRLEAAGSLAVVLQQE